MQHGSPSAPLQAQALHTPLVWVKELRLRKGSPSPWLPGWPEAGLSGPWLRLFGWGGCQTVRRDRTLLGLGVHEQRTPGCCLPPDCAAAVLTWPLEPPPFACCVGLGSVPCPAGPLHSRGLQ